ncbi:TetR family transcriptional regulator [Streptomyces longispororuber]|uniref:TetR family transcriptional regulator n=1 Tax=Streptomyces longispororuber TaxID=68230 RepID=A0A918ZLZ1_9ACTN|nr:TetR/AcrR family transcriptional regulator [Streptomyces longispororuber]GHE58059.1 TetR family transcriptional regulator [Streptomyces longispororuber]
MARPRQFDEDRVITAAMETFWRHGYEGTSTRDLCDATGLGPSSLYNTFGGKRELYLRALDRYHETVTAEQVAHLRGPGSAKERLGAMMLHSLEADLDPGDGRGCFAVNAAVELAGLDEDVRRVVRRGFDRVEDEVCAVVAAGQAAGEITPGRDPREVARLVQSTYYGLRVLARVRDDRTALEATVAGALAGL